MGGGAASSMVQGENGDAQWANIINTYSDFAGRDLVVLEDVYESEAATNQRNQAIGMLMYAYGHIKENPLEATDIYTRQCSVGVNAKDLANMAATLANGGVNPVTGKPVGFGMFEILEILGKSACLARIDRALALARD